tara:strand:+ start:105 stop:233 length:129 start_codon:yes stop_codon:yes gene_type:complete
MQDKATAMLKDFPKQNTPQYLKVQWMEKHRIELKQILKKASK